MKPGDDGVARADDGYVFLARISELRPGRQRAFQCGGHEILVCNVAGTFHAVRNRCPHAEERLEGGRMRDYCLTCPRHGARFDVRDGRLLAPPASVGIGTYPLRINGDAIEVCLQLREPPAL